MARSTRSARPSWRSAALRTLLGGAVLLAATAEAAPDYGVFTGPAQVFQCQSTEFFIPAEYQNLSPGGYNVTFSGSNWAGSGPNGNTFMPPGTNKLTWNVDVPAGVVFQLEATPWPASTQLRTFSTQTYLVNTGSSSSCLPIPSITYDPQILLTAPPTVKSCENVTLNWTPVNSSFTGPFQYWITLVSNSKPRVVPGLSRNFSQKMSVPGGATASSYTWLVDWPPGVVLDNYIVSDNVLLGLPSFIVQNGTSTDCIPDSHGGAAYRSPNADTTTLTSPAGAETGKPPTLPGNTGGAADSSSPTGIASQSSKSSSNAGPIAGGIVGGLAAGGALLATLLFWRRRQRRKSDLADDHTTQSSHEKTVLPPTPHGQPWASHDARTQPDLAVAGYEVGERRGGNLNASPAVYSPLPQGGGGEAGIQHRESQFGVQHRDPAEERNGGTVNW